MWILGKTVTNNIDIDLQAGPENLFDLSCTGIDAKFAKKLNNLWCKYKFESIIKELDKALEKDNTNYCYYLAKAYCFDKQAQYKLALIEHLTNEDKSVSFDLLQSYISEIKNYYIWAKDCVDKAVGFKPDYAQAYEMAEELHCKMLQIDLNQEILPKNYIDQLENGQLNSPDTLGLMKDIYCNYNSAHIGNLNEVYGVGANYSKIKVENGFVINLENIEFSGENS